MKIKKLLHFSFLLSFTIVATSFLAPLVDAATTTPVNPVVQQMLTIAQSKLDAENNVLISGDSTKLTQPMAQVSGLAAQGVSDIATVQLRRNKILADHGQHYTKAISKFTVNKSDISGNNAVITAYEYTKFTLVNDKSTDQIITEEGKTHELHFTRSGNNWNLIEDKILENSEPVLPLEGESKVTEKPLSLDTTTKHPAPSRNAVTSTNTMTAMTSGAFNPTNAVNYANSYWGRDANSTAGYNTAYRVYYDQNSGNLADCTNFVSQAMNWGGWQHAGGWYQDAHYWWYSPNNIVQWGNKAEAWSWINANYWYFFARYSGRVLNATYLSDFRPGDVLQLDYSSNDGILDHTEIVTTKDSNGNLYLTSHAINVHNKSFWDIYAQNPGAAYYGSLMLYQY